MADLYIFHFRHIIRLILINNTLFFYLSSILFGLDKLADEAFREVKKAKKLWIESAKENGKKIPEPRYKPVYYKVV